MKNCKSCCFWILDGKEDDRGIKYVGVGKCLRVKKLWQSTEFSHREKGCDYYVAKVSQKNNGDLAFVQDGEEYIADLYTKADFGCIQHKEKD